MNNQQRAQLGLDGNAAFALLGEDLQVGESEWVTCNPDDIDDVLVAAKCALHKLRARLGQPALSYYFGPSHPYGS